MTQKRWGHAHEYKEIMQTANKTPSMWLRYVDDMFSLWPHGSEELTAYSGSHQ